jgi:putative tricarboxylic transport membrane protein
VDCVFAGVFGFFGFALRRLDWPLFPVVLGLVLGSIIVERLSAGAGKIKFMIDLVNRPVSGSLSALTVLVIGYIIWSAIKNRGINPQ